MEISPENIVRYIHNSDKYVLTDYCSKAKKVLFAKVS